MLQYTALKIHVSIPENVARLLCSEAPRSHSLLFEHQTQPRHWHHCLQPLGLDYRLLLYPTLYR